MNYYKEDEGPSTGAVAAVVLLTLVVLGLITFICVRRMRWKRAAKRAAKDADEQDSNIAPRGTRGEII